MSTQFKPILFSTEMVQAILEGRKTQTRRTKGLEEINESPDDWVLDDTWLKSNSEQISFIEFKKKDHKTCKDYKSVYIKSFPYGNIGDILWVRESWQQILFKDKPIQYLYKANPEHGAMKWKPSIHMPKSACRLFLKIKDVRVQRLQDITKADAWAEGVKEIEKNEAYFDYMNEAGSYATAKGSFFSLWKSINGEDSFNANPWVWVIEFERVEKPTNF